MSSRTQFVTMPSPILAEQSVKETGLSLSTLGQWRNSYGLRVGKPAGTRAEGAPAGCFFTLVFQLRLLFQQGVPFQKGNLSWNTRVKGHPRSSVPAKITLSTRCLFPTLFFIVWLRNSHNVAFHKWNQNYLGAPTSRAERTVGGTLHM